MIKDIYDMTLKLITPSEKGKELDFSTKQDDILEAVCFFNDKFRTWSKRIIVYLISKKSIHLLLFMEKEKGQDQITARDIRFFTTYLNNQKQWNEYSRNTSKLFESVGLSRCSLDTAKRQIERLDRESLVYRAQIEEIEFFKKECHRSDDREYKDSQTEGAEDITDDDIITIVNYLVNTKKKGEYFNEKNETLSQIKVLLKKWL
jgi:hypothetical protein